MRYLFFLLPVILATSACKYKADVQCSCRNAQGTTNGWDLGIQTRPSNTANIARCDTLGAHARLDSCNLFISGN